MAVEIDGKTYRNLPEQVEENANNIQYLLDLIASMGNIMRYKGSVATYADLPTEDNQIGDVWNIIDTGNNYAWDGEAWDEIGSSIDLSGYPEKAQDETITGQWTFQNTLKTTLSTSSPTWNFTGYGASGLDIIYSDNSKGLKLTATLLRPQNDNDMSLGNSSYTFKDLYLSGTAYASNFTATNTTTSIDWGFSSNQYSNMQFERNSVGMFSMSSFAFFPNSNNSRDLGTNTLGWKDLYLGGDIYLGSGKRILCTGVEQVRFYNSGVFFAQDICAPANNTTKNLGRSGYEWNDLYLKGVLTDGTNSVSVADLANLIAYAKAQGWIS